jgi:4-amino-4-deoxy-L-arabinose transferase-like glycosyltransferase
VTRGRRVAVWLLVAAALALAILAQFYFFYRREYLWDGVVFLGLAAVCFWLALRTSRPGERKAALRSPVPWVAWLRTRPAVVLLLALGSFFSALATLLSWNRPLGHSSYDVGLLWGLGLASVALAALWPLSWPPRRLQDWSLRLRGVPRETWLELATVAALTLLAGLLRFAALDRVPFTLGGDEAWHGLLARQVLTGQLRNPFNMGYMSMPTLFYWPLSWSLWLVGDNLTGLRVPAALVGTLTVPVLYLFARDLWGKRTALLSALFLAAYDYHIHFSRLGANNVWDALFVLLALWALDRGLRKAQESAGSAELGGGSNRGADPWFLGAGLAMGLSVYFYTGARLLPWLVGIYVAFVWLQKRKQLKGLLPHLALLVLALLVAAGPMLGYAFSHPNEWNARINQVGILQSGWLAREPGLTGKSTVQILGEQFLHAAGAFNVFADRTVWYGADRPLLGFLAGAFAVLGMVWALAHWRDRRYFLVLLWFWSVIITGGMLTESPPSSMRLVIAIPAVALLIAFGLEQTVRLVGRLLSFGRMQENLALGVLVAILAISSINFYFVEFTPQRRYGSENGETATMMGYYLRDLDAGSQVYFFGAPRIYWNYGPMSFLAPGVSGQDVLKPLTAPPDFMDSSRGAVYLFLPDRSAELLLVQRAFPNGQLREFYGREGRLRFLAYEVE